MNLQAAKDYILSRLKNELRPDLYYHCLNHTLDVYESAKKLASLESIAGVDLVLLETAALYHDAGFIVSYKNHEEHSMHLMRKVLPRFGYADSDIEIIARMIIATRLPQNPVTDLEKILCDADLDYLGRDDFFMIANKLLCEWNENGIPVTLKKWYTIQKNFLESNHYFTQSAKGLRKEKKYQNLSQICELIS